MREKGSLFRKYFSIYAVTMLICIFMLGVILLFFAAQYFRDDNRISLVNIAVKGVEATEINFEKNKGFLTRGELNREFEIIHRTAGVTLFLCDIDGRVEICSDGYMCVHINGSIPSGIRDKILSSGEYFEIGYLDGFMSEGGYTYGCPVIIDDTIRGYLFISKPLGALFDFLYQVTVMFLLSSAAAFGISFIIVYYATRILTRPLNEISIAAARFGAGDYSVRVNVPNRDEIGILAEVFNNMASSVSELETIRRNFVADVSHELRTPMTTIAGYIDGILDGTIPHKEQNQYLLIITDEIKRLSRLTSALLTVARMEAGQQEVKIVSHNSWDIVLDTLWSMEQRITEKQIKIKELDVEPRFVMCDPDMLHQVIYNLLDNAIKFTPEQGYISVIIEKRNEVTDIAVKNSGVGISKEHMSRIFERFYKSDRSRSLDRQGVGLGLYITKTLVERMDGNITVSSKDDEYTEFIVSLKSGKKRVEREEIQKDKITEERDKQKLSFIRRISRGFRKETRR